MTWAFLVGAQRVVDVAAFGAIAFVAGLWCGYGYGHASATKRIRVRDAYLVRLVQRLRAKIHSDREAQS